MLDADQLESLSILDAVWVHPDIPPRKLRNARASHQLEDDETIWMLYDDTLWGGASDGLLLTDRRLSSKTLFNHPTSVPYTDAGTIIEDGANLHVAGLIFRFEPPGWNAFHVERIAAVLRTLIPPKTAVQRPWTDVLLSLARQHLGSINHVAFHPSLPENKLAVVRRTHDLMEDEQLLAFCDLTLFGSARDHWALTDKRLLFKPFLESAGFIGWTAWLTTPLKTTQTLWPGGDFIFGEPEWDAFHTAMGTADTPDARNPELEARIHASPDDQTNRWVYLDWLLEQPHPRGELAMLQQQNHPFEDWLEHHRLTFFPPVETRAYEATWLLGYWDELTIYMTGLETDEELVHRFSSLLQHANARFLRVLNFEQDEDWPDLLVEEPMLTALRAAELPSLQRLHAPGCPLPHSVRARFPHLLPSEDD